jgi:hypothetical protein
MFFFYFYFHFVKFLICQTIDNFAAYVTEHAWTVPASAGNEEDQEEGQVGGKFCRFGRPALR